MLTNKNKQSACLKSRRAARATTPRTCTAKFTNKWGSKISNFRLTHKSGDRVDTIKFPELSPDESKTMSVVYTTGFQSRPDLWWVRFEVGDGPKSVTWSSPTDSYYDLIEEDENTEIVLWIDGSEKTLYVRRAEKAVEIVKEPKRITLRETKRAT